ncbi:DUF3080 domain-containing protein [Vibrio ouci]|uniref:DUF3080 domain-containing protein n=1 Tax=Vibrio ouci TaxID=2499078 RepID=A0A4Y8WGM7_9VIBR|nr:DUF3080 domain-containing protein [Vibrio ouci]TFH91755.1 DUF3080 domain-containing protein [Vibrio ouci]
MRIRLFTTSIAVILLVGCDSHSPATLFTTYLDRVASVQDAPVLEDSEPNQTLPRKRDLSVDIPAISLGLLDSYQLRQCGLFQLIAERNSVLGKVADQFSNYDYQHALLLGLTQCIASHEISDELKQTLQQIEQQKRLHLPMHQWNLLYASDAMQSQLSGTEWLQEGIGAQVKQVKNALSSVANTFENTESTAELTRVQETLEKTPIVGNLNYSLVQATWHLVTITEQLYRYDSRIICGPQRDTTKYRYLNNVFEQRYIGTIQPYLASLDSYYQQLSHLLPLFASKPELHDYVYPLESNHQAFRAAIKQHVGYWQQLFKRCGRKIG